MKSSDGIAQWNISEPFNFEHIMHTTPQKVKEIDELSHSDLIAEFSSLRCSQLGTRSRELKGIKTTEIHRETFLPQAIVSGNSSPSLPPLKHRVSPPISPRRRKWQEEDARYDTPVITVPSPSRSLRSAASVENFSQPSPRLYKAPFAPRSPPPRSSSRNAAPDFFTSYQELPTDAAFEPDVHASLEPSTCLNETWEADAYDLEQPHAVTTPDDTAHSLQSPPYTIVRTELAGVPEEDEISLSEGKRISTDTLILRTPTPTSALRHAKSFPSTHASSPRPHRWSGALPQTPEVDDAAIAKQSSAVNTHTIARFSSEEHVDEVPVRPRFSKHLSMKREESWEDIIDYCYEHEAEANCDFDWDRVSLHGKLPEVPAPSVSNDAKSSPEISTLHDRSSVTSIPKHSIRSRSSSAYSASPPLLLPLQTFLPELDDPSANSAVSSFNSISEAVTPLDPSGTTAVTQTSVTDFRDNWSDAADPSYPGVVGNVGNEHDSFILQEDLYHQIITGELLPKQHPFPFSVGHVDGSTIDESPRSSRSPISKSSSQESFWYAKAAKRQRNTGSIDSLPDLMGGKTRLDAGTEQFGEHSGILNPTESASDAAPMRRHNIPNLAKDVALKSILAKAMTSEEHLNAAELPLHPALRDRAGSDAAFGLGDIGTIPPPPVGEVNLARRVRSTSSASSMSQRASRASYSLFPQSINRQA